MTALCGGGASTAKPGTPAVAWLGGSIAEAAIVDILGLPATWASLLVFAAGTTLATSGFCSTDPPAITWPNAIQIAELLANPLGAPLDAQSALQSVVTYGAWLLLCECSAPPQPPAPAVPTYPPTAPVQYPFNPSIPGNSYGVQILNDAPSHWWRLQESPSPLVLDHVATPHHFLSSSPQNTAFAFTGPATGSAAYFVSGSLDINSENAISHTNVYSLELWFWSPSTLAVTRELLAWDGSSVNADNIWLDSTGKLHWDGPDTGFSVVSAGPVSNGVWHHVVATNTSTLMTLYLDGVSIGTTAITAQPGFNGNCYIGGRAETGVGATALLSEYAVYPTVLSAARVLAHYNAADLISGSPTFIGPGAANPTSTSSTTQISNSNSQFFQQIQNTLSVIYQNAPFTIKSLVDGPIHSNVSGNGTIALAAAAVAVRVDITTDLPTGTSAPGDPTYLFNRGFIVPIAIGTPIRDFVRLLYNPQMFYLPHLTDTIGYTIPTGMIVTITELQRAD